MKTTDEPIIVEQTFNSSVESVWNSITEIEQMRKWYFENIPAFKPVVGFETQFNVQSEERNFLHIWKVVEVLKDFPDDIPEFTRESCLASWEYFINGRLKDYVKND